MAIQKGSVTNYAKKPWKKVLALFAQKSNLSVLFGIDIQSTIFNKQFER